MTDDDCGGDDSENVLCQFKLADSCDGEEMFCQEDSPKHICNTCIDDGNCGGNKGENIYCKTDKVACPTWVPDDDDSSMILRPCMILVTLLTYFMY